tara:strand:+ start:1612 stop:1920 length:309 start_codon:yes stop_codon:yes gene_type:complete
MKEKEERGFGEIMYVEFCRAIPWGITFSVCLFLSVSLLFCVFKQDVKEAVDYTQTRAIDNLMVTFLDEDFFLKVKQNTKETIEFAVKSINEELVAPYRPHQE